MVSMFGSFHQTLDAGFDLHETSNLFSPYNFTFNKHLAIEQTKRKKLKRYQQQKKE